MRLCRQGPSSMITDRDFFIDNSLVRIHCFIEVIWWTSLAPWEIEFPFPGSLVSTFLDSPISWDYYIG